MTYNKLILPISLILLLPISALADMRSYVWTYEYMIMEPGKAEIEHYLTFSAPKTNEIRGNTSVQHRLEIEVGMNHFFDFSIYENFEQIPDSNFTYTGFDLRARFKIGEKNMFPIDPLFYLEYSSNATLSKHKFEGKLILAKDIGALNFAFNPIIEIEKEGNEIDFAIKYAMGVRYQFTQLFRLGVEFKGDRDAHYVGITFSHGREHLWIAFSPTFRFATTGATKNEFQLRTIVGLGL